MNMTKIFEHDRKINNNKQQNIIYYDIGHVPILMFVNVKNFQSYSNQNLVILIEPCELASKNITHYFWGEIHQGF